MSKFLSMMPITPRTIDPEYVSQWDDTIFFVVDNTTGVDYIREGYPYSYANLQLSPEGDGATNLLYTEDGHPLITFDENYITSF